MTDTGKKDNSLFLYTALIFIVAIVLIILAFFGQTRVNNVEPTVSPEAVETESPETLQGIAKSASQLSAENLELLNENRDLNKQLNEAETKIEVFEKLLDAYEHYSNSDYEGAKFLLNELDYNSLTSQGKILYDFINSNIQ